MNDTDAPDWMAAFNGGTDMCPHCGSLVAVYDRLTCQHGYQGERCPGSEQIPRNPESDGRPLWNGERNRFFGRRLSVKNNDVQETEE